MKKYGESENINFKNRGGSKPIIATSRKFKSIENLFQQNQCTTVPAAAKKLKINANYLYDIKAHKLGIKAHTKKSEARHTETQKATVTAWPPKPYSKILPKSLVIADESYVLEDPEETPGRQFFYAKNPPQVKTEDKIKCV